MPPVVGGGQGSTHPRPILVVVDLEHLARRIVETCLVEGSFTLRSGRQSDRYFDKYLFEARPDLLEAVAEHLAPLVPQETEVLAGLELGGVPIATALGMATGLPLAFVRKAAKTYGTMKLAEGTDVAGRNVLIVEDVISTGGQVATSAADLREAGAEVDTALCVIDRSDGTHDLDRAGIELRSLFRSADLEQTRPAGSGDGS